MSNTQVSEHHKEVKVVHTCPKCGNTEGLITIAGTGSRFYYCPACFDAKHPKTTQTQS